MSKILVVDDAEDARFLLTRLLHLGGFATDMAEDGLDALAHIEASPPDLILLDMMMPRMNGLQMLGTLRQDPRWRDLPVVLYTAVSDNRWLDEAERLGVQDVIVKGSVDGDHLLERIARGLDAKAVH
jgi:CheY-like chemotaxis protein